MPEQVERGEGEGCFCLGGALFLLGLLPQATAKPVCCPRDQAPSAESLGGGPQCPLQNYRQIHTFLKLAATLGGS